MPVIPFHDENPIQRTPFVTVAIIVINVISLIYVQGMDDFDQRRIVAQHGFVPARLNQLNNPNPIRVPIYSQEELAQGVFLPPNQKPFLDLPAKNTEIIQSMLTSLFMHAGWLHLISNMWFFWIFGNNIEDRLGHFVFLLYYLLGGVVACISHWAMMNVGGNVIPVIGASGAVAVTLGSYAVTYPFARVKTLIFLFVFFTVVELPALVILGFWFLMQVANGAHVVNMNIGGGVAWWAHIGGFAAGAILMPFLAAGSPEPGRNWQIEAKEQFDYDLPPRDYS